jgi:hypothetical protein
MELKVITADYPINPELYLITYYPREQNVNRVHTAWKKGIAPGNIYRVAWYLNGCIVEKALIKIGIGRDLVLDGIDAFMLNDGLGVLPMEIQLAKDSLDSCLLRLSRDDVLAIGSVPNQIKTLFMFPRARKIKLQAYDKD